MDQHQQEIAEILSQHSQQQQHQEAAKHQSQVQFQQPMGSQYLSQ